MITWISSILAFIAGCLFCLTCLIHCSDEGLKRFIDTLYRVRKGDKKDE